VNLYAAFLDAGLFTADESHKISAWKAMPWPAGGAAAVMLADPSDDAVRAQVSQLLNRLSSDPRNGIDRILSHEEIVEGGGFPDAAFLVSFKIGYEFGAEYAGPIVSKPTNQGMHGYVPGRPEMRSSFFIAGPRVAAGRSLGEIDMRQIAPTLARVLHAPLKDAELAPLPLEGP
jgi:predicted AlkP superfamily pyrophosphatase or phosphodiesterase